MTEQEIKDKWTALHDTLSALYYQPLGKYAYRTVPTAEDITAVETAMGEACVELDKDNFDRIHGALWAACDDELVANGYEPMIPPPPEPPV